MHVLEGNTRDYMGWNRNAMYLGEELACNQGGICAQDVRWGLVGDKEGMYWQEDERGLYWK